MKNKLLGHIRCYDCEHETTVPSGWLKKIQYPSPMNFLFTLAAYQEIFQFLQDHSKHKIMWVSEND